MGSFKAKVCFDSLILSCASYQHNVKAILILQILNICLAGKQRTGVRNIFAITWFLFLLRQMGHSTTFRFFFSFFTIGWIVQKSSKWLSVVTVNNYTEILYQTSGLQAANYVQLKSTTNLDLVL